MTNQDRLPELLAPAGNMEKLATAVRYGADAVYLGGPGLNLRAGAGGFTDQELPHALDLAHAAGVKAYYLLNILPRESHLDQVRAHLDRLGELAGSGRGPDAVIAADAGVIRLLRRHLPDMDLHVSTQANTANSQAAAFWRDLGATRVNVAREVRREELADMLAACTDGQAAGLELEVFVHGAQCMAVSGQCLLSAWLTDRPGNLGQCAHPCRYEYRAVLEEARRPGRATWEVRIDRESDGDSSDETSREKNSPIGADGNKPLAGKASPKYYSAADYASLLAPGDLCLIHELEWMSRAGVAAFKIEGRTKSSAYLAQVADAYATALARLRSGKALETKELMAELVNTASRPLTSGFFCVQGGAPAEQPVLAEPLAEPRRVLCRILEPLAPGRWAVEAKHTWDVDHTPVELMLPGLARPRLAASEFRLEDEFGHTLAQAHPGMRAVLACDRPELTPDAAPGLFLRAAPK